MTSSSSARDRLARLRRGAASDALRAKGAAQIFNLDRDLAVDTFKQAIAADPDDPAAYRGLATALWLSITFRRGNMTVDDYLGRPNKPNANPLPNPPADAVAGFRDAIDKATALAHAAAAGTSLIGSISMNSIVGLVATIQAAASPTIGRCISRPSQ